MNTSGEIKYALRQVRYWLGRVERLTASDASDAERRQETEEEKSPSHTPLKEYLHRVRAREANFDDLFDRRGRHGVPTLSDVNLVLQLPPFQIPRKEGA